MSHAYHGEDDSDEDRVVYLDYDQSVEERNNPGERNYSKTNNRESKAIKFKPLFQQKRYKGDLEKERYIDNIEDVLWEGKAQPTNDDRNELDDEAYSYEGQLHSSQVHKAPMTVSSSGRKALSPGFKRSFAAMTSPIERSPTPVSPSSPYIAAPSTSSASRPVQRAPEVNVSGMVDVGEDRPSHWNRMRPNVPAKSAANKSTTKSTKNAKLTSNVKPIAKVVQIPKPKALPSQPASLSFGENSNSRPSFRPSWLTTQSGGPSSGSSQQPTRVERIGTPAAEERLLIETIQEVEESSPGAGSYSSSFRPPPARSLQLDHTPGRGGDFDEPTTVSSADLQARHPVSHVSPQRALTVNSLSTPHHGGYGVHSPGIDGSGAKLTRGHSTYARGTGTSKARPGSLKAKLQKIWRDTDANENRIINIPADPQQQQGGAKARALDLQDPRSRAAHYVDVQVVEVLPDQAPFRVALLSVMGSWRKRNVEIEAVQVANGASLLGYFKPDTCVGHGRALEESVILRVYEPQLWPAGNDSDIGGLAIQVDYVMINTNCWELADAAL